MTGGARDTAIPVYVATDAGAMFTLRVDPGSAPPDVVAAVFGALAELYFSGGQSARAVSFHLTPEAAAASAAAWRTAGEGEATVARPGAGGGRSAGGGGVGEGEGGHA